MWQGWRYFNDSILIQEEGDYTLGREGVRWFLYGPGADRVACGSSAREAVAYARGYISALGQDAP